MKTPGVTNNKLETGLRHWAPLRGSRGVFSQFLSWFPLHTGTGSSHQLTMARRACRFVAKSMKDLFAPSGLPLTGMPNKGRYLSGGRVTPTGHKSNLLFFLQSGSPYGAFKTGAIKYLICGLTIFLFSCHGSEKAADDEDAKVASQTPVTVTNVSDSTLTDYIDLNATSTILQKNFVKSNANGYIEQVNAQLGQNVSKGQLLFTVKTKEAQAIGNSINVLDTSFKFSGVNRIKASAPGYISQLSHQKGDYVQDGEALATINDRGSFVFLMQLPYEMRQYVKQGQTVDLTLPGGIKLPATVSSFMQTVDTVAQTQGVALKVNTAQQIPENLIAKARIVKSAKTSAQSLPKSAILTNETQTEFWVMKLINPTTAVKIPVKEGIQAGDRVEILSPSFTKDDKIVVTGNYGLPDTAKVKIIAQ